MDRNSLNLYRLSPLSGSRNAIDTHFKKVAPYDGSNNRPEGKK